MLDKLLSKLREQDVKKFSISVVFNSADDAEVTDHGCGFFITDGEGDDEDE